MRKTYIIAVSGGVDSVALLHRLTQVKPDSINYVVAHVDHGIRSDSTSDAEFVHNLAEKYHCAFEIVELKLGANASEESARDARYDFLYTVMKKYKAEGIITAHHQDDVLETMLLNMLRGTGPRGLVGYSRTEIVRPFINKTKKDLVEYANKHKLSWREDSTNSDEKYLRNYVRAKMMPKLGERKSEFLIIRDSLQESYREIDSLMKKLLVNSIKKGELVRSRFVILPVIVQHELMATWLRLNDVVFDSATIDRITVAAKTLEKGKVVDITKTAKLKMNQETISLII